MHSPSAQEIRTHLASKYGAFQDPAPLKEIIDDVSDMLRKWSVHVTHPRYFGLFNPSVSLASVAGDTLTAVYNPQLAAWSHGPASNEIERHVLDFFLSLLEFDPENGFGNFTSGGAEANLTAVIVALSKAFPDYGDQGAAACGPHPKIYLSEESHHSFVKIAHMTGIGREALCLIEVDDSLKMDAAALEKRIDEDKKKGHTPFMVIGTGGTTGAGVIDPLPDLAQICRRHGLWFHVDAAWAGAALLSRKLKPCLAGIESSDSVTLDAHKWLSVPMGAGMFFCRDRQAVEETFAIQTGYMPAKTGDILDPYATTVQWSRRFTGLKVFMPLAQLGQAGYEELIDKQADMGDFLREHLEAKNWKVVNRTPLPVVCFTHDDIEKDEAKLDSLLQALYSEGKFWISKVHLSKGKAALRACITSFRTEQSDLETLVDTLNDLLAG
jgi:glutamate/tyrosine decarboxylase-like PLP-dependent enzyme